MRRFTPALLVAAAAFGLAGVAQAGGPALLVTHPTVGDDEFAGINTIVTMTVPAGLDGVEFGDTEPFTGTINLLDDTGMVVFGNLGVTLVGAPAYNNAALNTVQADLSTVAGLSALLSNAAVIGIQFRLTTPTGTGLTGAFDAMDEAVDQTTENVLGLAAFNSAFFDSDNDRVFFVFDRSMNTGAAGNDDNHTVLASITGADFQFDTSNSFDGTEGAPAGLSNPMFVGADNTTISFDVAMGSDVQVGRFIRANHDNMGDPQNDLFDLAHNRVNDIGVQVTELADLAILEAKWIERVPAGGGAVADALKVTFNNPINTAGDAGGGGTFWNDMALLLDGSDSDIDITAAAIDPDDARCILLSVNAGGADGVAADGLDEDTLGTFSISVDSMTGTPPQDIFSQDFDGTATEDAIDCILPERAAGFANAAHADCDGDGTQDAIKIVYDEPLGAGAASSDGFTLLANDGVTVHPVFATDLRTGARAGDPDHPVEALRDPIMTDIDAMANELDIDSVELGSTDVNGDGDIDARETNNTVIVKYDLDSVDWDGDGDSGASDTDGEATGTTDDSGLVNVDFVAADGDVADAAGNATETDFTVNSTVDCSAPVNLAINFLVGDNLSGGMQKPSEQDGNVGDDDDNNTAQFIFTEGINIGGLNRTEFRFGPNPNQTFEAGDDAAVLGTDGNILQLIREASGGDDPLTASDSITVRPDNGVTDGTNEFAGVTSQPMTDITAPFVALQVDVNGNAIFSGFLIEDASNPGFASSILLFFNKNLDADTVQDEDFSVTGVDDDDISVSVNGAVVTITLPAATVPVSVSTDVTYNGATDDTPLADEDGNAVAMMDDTFEVQAIPTPNVDAEFPWDMIISGRGTTDGTASLPIGTKVFGMIAVPVAKSIRVTMGNITSIIDDESSLEAVTNVILGIHEFAYLYDNQGEMFIENEKFDDFSTSVIASLQQLTINSNNLTNVTFSGRGVTVGGTATVAAVSSSGRIVMSWDVLRSGDGTAFSLFDNGYQRFGTPITSTTVITSEPATGANYVLHMTAPVRLTNLDIGPNAIGNPVIVVVELPTGERCAVSSLLNRVGGGGPIAFNPNQRRQNGTAAPSDTLFNYRLDHVGKECMWAGWNLLKFARVSGFASASGSQALPLRTGVTTNDVFIPSNTNPLPVNATTLSQFCYWYDFEEDGLWTADDDDGGRFDGLVIDANCFQHFAFTLTSRGVQVSSAFNGRTSNGILTLTGGYAAGFFNGDGSKIGVMQFGAPLATGALFGASPNNFPNNNTTLGWALVTYVPDGDSDTVAEFFSTNTLADFFITFNRTDHNEVEIGSGSEVSGGSTTADEVICQGMFVHSTPN